MSFEHLIITPHITHDMGHGNPQYVHDVYKPCPVEQGLHYPVHCVGGTANHYMQPHDGNDWYSHQTCNPCPLDAPSCTPPS